MDLQLKGKRALVTGSSSGIGAETARWLAAEGAHVVIHGRRTAAVADLVKDLQGEGLNAAGVTGDLSSDAGADAAATAALAAFGGIDILVNNAGQFVVPDKTEPAQWFGKDTADHGTALFEANVNSVFRMVQRVVPNMQTRGWGRVIMLGSVLADLPGDQFPHYGLTKSANLNQAVNLSRVLAGTGITVNSISPGVIRTPMTEPLIWGMASQFGWGNDWDVIEVQAATHAFAAATPRLGRPEDIARAVAFLASPLSDFINGANMRVDGGMNPTVN